MTMNHAMKPSNEMRLMIFIDSVEADGGFKMMARPDADWIAIAQQL